MRLSTLILVLILGVVTFPREGAAEKVKANQDTKLFARPGERAKVIAKVTEGKQMTVLAKEGRWLKVRVQGRTGYVARSTVDLPDDEEIARNTRRRSFVDGRGTKRGFGGESGPDDRVGADAVGDGQGGGDDEEEEEEDEDDPPAKAKPVKTPATPPAKPAAKPPAKGGDDDDEEDDENPVAAKTPAKPTKTAAREDDEDDEDEDEDEEDDDEDEEDTRPRLKIARKTTMYNDADPKSETILVATKDTLLFPTGEKKGKYTEVENEEGDLGYVLTADISSGGEVREDDDDDDVDAPAVGGGGGSQIDLRARAGVTLMSQGLRTPGGTLTVPDNYDISTSAVTIALGGGYYRAMGKKLVVGAEGMYEYANAFGGIPTPPATMGGAKTTTKISMHNVNVRGVVGLDFKKASGMMLLGRLGVRYHSYQVANAASMEKNTARFPSEIITSPTIGAAFALPRLTNKIGLRFSMDFIPLNISYSQTKNLEDGKSPSAKGAIVGLGLTYRWRPSIDIQAAYDLTYSKSSFGAAVPTSMRGHPATGNVTRTDVFHSVTAGIVKAF